MKIAHISDTHIRNLKYHYEYKVAFADLYKKLKQMSPDIIVHTGDIAHTKTQLSPEFFQMCSAFLHNLAEIAPTYIILGNHDGNLKNDNRQDAITPIVQALEHKDIHLLKNSGETKINEKITLNVLSVFDRENWIKPTNRDCINIGLYHGSIHGCQTSQGYTIEEGEDSVDIFSDFDFGLLGDIHKQQKMDLKGRVRYAGSTVQQNFGESINKGFLMWNIRDKYDWDCQHVTITNPRPFVTVDLTPQGKLPTRIVPRGCRLRIRSSANISPMMLKAACDYAQSKWQPYSVSFINNGTMQSSSTSLIGKAVQNENLRDLTVQEKYIRAYCKDLNLKPEVMDKILILNKKYNQTVEETEEISRNVIWKIKEMQWDNLFNYGEKNKINFEKLSGLVGIFGKNYSGKSSIIDSVLYNVFNTTSKGERKNVHIINQNKDYAKCKIKIEAGNDSYQITRNLNKYTKKSKGKETFEAKVDLDFTKTTAGIFESKNGTTRNETDANIRKHFGTIDDFFLTSMSSQMDSMSFLREGSTKRKEIIAKFLDLQIFDQKYKLARKDAADLRGVIKRMESKKFEEQLMKKNDWLQDIQRDIDEQIDKCKIYQCSIERRQAELAEINKTINAIPAEIIDILAVQKEIAFKRVKKTKLLSQNLASQENIHLLDKYIDIYVKQLDVDSLDRLKQMKVEAKQQEEIMQGFDRQLRQQKRLVANLDKTASMLHDHEYDPNCSFCCDNEFVKEAEKAKEELPYNMNLLADLGDSLDAAKLKFEDYGIESIERNIQKFKELSEEYDSACLNIERSRMSIQKNEATIALLANEIDALETKAKDYEDNRQAIENKEQLFGERKAVEAKIKENKTLLKKCDESTKEYLIEEATTKEMIRSIHEERSEFTDVMNEYRAYDIYMTCMHANGISYEIIQQKLPIINREISKVLSNIVDFEVFFENHSNKLELSIKHPNYDPRPLSMGSGAEKTIASMAIRLAMIAITNLPKSELFILDEPATALDQEHMEGFTRLLQMIKNQFKTVLIISHLDHLKDVVDMTIDIDKIDGYAKVNI
jgi:DNA repair exonuclease SbcCD ATPase subunit/DNA repair exonuclease SbcCD nuclease subunit